MNAFFPVEQASDPIESSWYPVTAMPLLLQWTRLACRLVLRQSMLSSTWPGCFNHEVLAVAFAYTGPAQDWTSKRAIANWKETRGALPLLESYWPLVNAKGKSQCLLFCSMSIPCSRG